MRRETYGGGLYDLGCYCTSMITWLLGKEPVSLMNANVLGRVLDAVGYV